MSDITDQIPFLTMSKDPLHQHAAVPRISSGTLLLKPQSSQTMSKDPLQLDEKRRPSSQTRMPESKKPRLALEVEDRLRQLYDLVPVGDPGPKHSTVFCKECQMVLDVIKGGLWDYERLLGHAWIHESYAEGESKRDQTQLEEDKHDEAVFRELPFHEDLVAPHLHGQTKMEEAEYVQHSVKADGLTEMEEDEYVEHSVKGDFSEHQLHQLFELVEVDQPPEDKEHIKRMRVVCELCGGIPDRIMEGSSLQDCRAVQEHASLHRDVSRDLPNQWIDQNTSMEITRPKSYSEEELLRIYVLDSGCVQGYKRNADHTFEKLEKVWYVVICKLCYRDVYKPEADPSGRLHESRVLQDHALRHSEYLCVDGPPVPELDLKDYRKAWLTMDEDGFLSFEDDASVPRGFVKICRWCKCENCSSGNYGIVRIQCGACCEDFTHMTYECPAWEIEFGQLIPCNGVVKRLTTTLMESWKDA